MTLFCTIVPSLYIFLKVLYLLGNSVFAIRKYTLPNQTMACVRWGYKNVTNGRTNKGILRVGCNTWSFKTTLPIASLFMPGMHTTCSNCCILCSRILPMCIFFNRDEVKDYLAKLRQANYYKDTSIRSENCETVVKRQKKLVVLPSAMPEKIVPLVLSNHCIMQCASSQLPSSTLHL